MIEVRDSKDRLLGGSHRFDDSHEVFPDSSNEECGDELKVALVIVGEGLRLRM